MEILPWGGGAKKGDIPITQMDGEVEVLGEDRLQSKF
jgi:hypothetical protein